MVKTFVISFTSCHFIFPIFNVWLHHFENGLTFLEGRFLIFLDAVFVVSHVAENFISIEFFGFKDALIFQLRFFQLFRDIFHKLLRGLFVCFLFSSFSVFDLFYFYFIEESPELFIWFLLIFGVRIFGGFIIAIESLLQQLINLSGFGECFRT